MVRFVSISIITEIVSYRAGHALPHDRGRIRVAEKQIARPNRELALAELVDRVCEQTRVETAKANERARKQRVYHALSKAERKASNRVRHAARAQRHATESSAERKERLAKRRRAAKIKREGK